MKLGRGRDKSHQFSTDRYTEQTFIKIEVAIFLLQGAHREYRFRDTDEDGNALAFACWDPLQQILTEIN